MDGTLPFDKSNFLKTEPKDSLRRLSYLTPANSHIFTHIRSNIAIRIRTHSHTHHISI